MFKTPDIDDLMGNPRRHSTVYLKKHYPCIDIGWNYVQKFNPPDQTTYIH